MIRPSLEEFRKLAKPGKRVPVVREILADTDTPVSAFLKIAGSDQAFLLESVESGERWARYSILGTNPSGIYTAHGKQITIESNGNVRTVPAKPDARVELEKWQQSQKVVPIDDLPPFWGGAVGFLSYDAVRSFERLPDLTKDDLGVPEAAFLLVDTVVVFDNLSLTMKVISSEPAGKDPDATWHACAERVEELVERLHAPLAEAGPDSIPRATQRFRSNFTKTKYRAAVEDAKEYIRSGDAVQVVLSQRFEKRLGCDPFDVYRSLRVINPSSYMYYLKLGDRHLVGSSPEVLVRRTGDRIELRPIAGTRPRGETRSDDLVLEAELLADEKERAEHVMLVDLGRNDVGRVARFGSVEVSEFMTVERYSHVMHLVSNVIGEARPGISSLDVLRACFPAGTVTGAPKVRAMELIEEMESVRRGTYAGAVGYLSFDGNLDTCIAIRTAYIEDGTVRIGTGAGIVADSRSAHEYRETVDKAGALFAAVEAAERRVREGRDS